MWCYCVFQISTSVTLLCFRLPSAWCYCVSDRYWCGVFSRRPAAWCHCVSDLYWCGVVYFSGVRQRGVIVCFRPLLVCVFFRRPAASCHCVFQTSIGVVWCIFQTSGSVVSVRWTGFSDIEEVGPTAHHSGIRSYSVAVGENVALIPRM